MAKRAIAAGIEVPDAVHGGGRGVLTALRDVSEQHSENDLSEKLRLHAVYYFGPAESQGCVKERPQSFVWLERS